jgi:ATP-dependent Clp protease protease subunit
MAKNIILFDTITPDSAANIVNDILSTEENEEINLLIDSPGGSVTSGWAIIAAMQQRNVNITVMGDASSMAFIMLVFAQKVTIHDTSNFLVHRAASWWEDVMEEDELKDIESRNKVIRKKLEERINQDEFKKATGSSFDDIFSMDDRLDVRLNATKLKKIGLVDEVIKIDVKKRKEIESRYFADIAALAQPIININKKEKKMGLLQAIFGEKDPILLAQIDENQVVYSKLEKGSKIKAVGNDEKNISGTFEADGHTVTVVENEITAVTKINESNKRIEALESKLDKLIEAFEKPEEKPEEDNSVIEALEAKVEKLSGIIEAAKLQVSNPNLPLGEFAEEVSVDNRTTEYKVKQEIEAIAAEKQALRDAKRKGGN